MKNILRREVVVNAFGAVGYTLLVAAWTFFLAVLLSSLFEAYASQGQSSGVLSPSPKPNPTSAGPVVVVAGYIITGLIAAVSLAIVATLPYFIGRWGSRILKAFMKLCRIDMTKRQLFFVKAILAILPLVGLMIMQFILRPEDITFAAMYGGAVILSVLAITSSLTQTLLARRFKLAFDRLW